LFGENAAFTLSNPGTFAMRALRAFKANQGPAAGRRRRVLHAAVDRSAADPHADRAVARHRSAGASRHARALSRVADSRRIGGDVVELRRFVENRGRHRLVLFVTMLFFSSLAFTVLENAMSVIFVHRVVIRRRHFFVSAILPYCYIVASASAC
jgi:hypothetical protein